MSTSFRAQQRWVSVALVGVLVVGASLVAWAVEPEVASATPGAPTPGQAQQIGCDGEGMTSGAGSSYGETWVPEGGQVTFTASNIRILPSQYVGNGRGEYQYFVRVRDGSTQLWEDWNYANIGVVWHGEPYEWVEVEGTRPIGTFVNTGDSKMFSIEAEGRRSFAGAGTTWTLDVAVQDEDGDPATGNPPCPDELSRENAGDNQASDYACPAQGEAGDPVNTLTGNLHMPGPGMSVPGRGMGLPFDLAYNSVWAAQLRRPGYGWTSTLDMTYTERTDGTVEVLQETGATIRFREDGSGTGIDWVAPKRLEASLRMDAANTQWVFTRNHFEQFGFRMSDRRLTWMKDRFGRTTTIHYPSSSSKPDYMEDSAGRRFSFTWEGERLKTVSDQLPSGQGGPRTLVFTYTSNNLTSLKDADGGTWVYTYDTNHRLLTMRKPRHTSAAKVIENHYDAQGRVDWQEDELNRRTTFQYDAFAPDATIVYFPDGDTRFDIYEDGRRETIVHQPGASVSFEETFTYDDDTWACTSHTDGRGQTWEYINDANGNRITEQDPELRIREWEYNEYDQVLRVETGKQLGVSTAVVATTFDYDPTTHNLELVTQADGTADEAVTDLVYGTSTRPEDVTAVVDPRGKTWTVAYDAATGSVTSETDPEGNTTGYQYNAIGWPTRITAPKGTATTGVANDFITTYGYDLTGRKLTITDAEGNVTREGYDANGNLTSVAEGITGANPTGDVTTYAYDDADQLLTVDAPGAGSTAYTYWPDGTRKTHTNGLGGTWQYAYDDFGRLITETAPTGDVTRYGWDKGDRLVTITQPGPSATCTGTKVGCITYSYDESGLPTRVDFSDSGTPDVANITYDGHGRRTSAQAPTTETWTWNARHQLTSVTDANGTTGYGWDDGGNLTSLTYPGQTTPVVREFDDASRLVSVTDWLGNETTFDYDANSNWSSTAFPAGSGLEDTYGYDDADRVTSVGWEKAGTSYGSETYTRGTKGLIGTRTPTGIAGSAPTGYGYDARARLTSAGTATYTYDAASNLTTTPDGRLGVYDPSERLCWASPTATTGTCAAPPADADVYGYDTRGNRTRVDGPDDTRTTNTYDQANRLTKVSEGPSAPISEMSGTPIAGDFDGDDHDDVFWYGPGAASDHATWGEARSSFGRTTGDFAVAGASYQPLSGDFNGDGQGDIFWYVPGTAGEFVWFWFGRESGDHTSKPFTVNGTYVPQVGDFDGDGYDDVLWYSPGTGGDPIWWGSATVDDTGTTFGQDAETINGTFEPVTGDFDGNGSSDVFWYAPGATADFIWWGTSTRGGWIDQPQTVNGSYTLSSGDFDGDAKDDVLFHSASAGDPLWWGNTRTAFGSAGSAFLDLAGTVTPVIGDFDGDAKDDLLVYKPGAAADSAWWGTTRANFGTAAAQIGLAPESTTVSTYAYGAAGQLLRQVTGGVTTTYVWDQTGGTSQLLAKGGPGGRSYVITGPGGRPISQIDPGSAVTYLHTDGFGSVVAATGPTGAVVSTQTWDPFGNVEGSTGTTQPIVGWQGQPTDPATGDTILEGGGGTGLPPQWDGGGWYDPTTGGNTTEGPSGGRSPRAPSTTTYTNLHTPVGAGGKTLADHAIGYRHTVVNLLIGVVTTVVVASLCGASVVCAVAAVVGATVIGTLLHQGSDWLFDDPANDQSWWQSIAHSLVSAAIGALCGWNLGQGCGVAAGGLRGFGPAIVRSTLGQWPWYFRFAPAAAVALGSGLHWLIDQFADEC